MTGQTIIDKITSQKKDLSNFGIIRLGLFGSAVRDEITKKSDIDILVEFKPSKKTFRNFMDTVEYMENLTGRPVDIVTPESLSPYIKPHILKEIVYVEIAN